MDDRWNATSYLVDGVMMDDIRDWCERNLPEAVRLCYNRNKVNAVSILTGPLDHEA